MSLKGVAKETLSIVESGSYVTPSGVRRLLGSAVDRAVDGTRLYVPARLSAIVPQEVEAGAPPTILISNESTQRAAWRLCAEGVEDPLVLNFASARNVGGGFLRGAKSQEEDLCRSSALYPCLMRQPTYYEANRREASLLYTDHLIYSPRVPWFRIRSRELLERPFIASVVTAPAPNRGEVLRRNPGGAEDVRSALKRRAGYVLAVAKDNCHRALILGAWGCGVFQNVAAEVAGVFGYWLETTHFGTAFDLVVFAVLDRSRGCSTLAAFEDRFATAATAL